MTVMIYDYEDNEGWVSVWVGNFTDYETLDGYLSTDYDGVPEDSFLPENRNRPFEEELREHFNGETFCQFEYDFGLTFDEDFREAQVLPRPARDLEELIPFSESTGFVPLIREQYGDTLPAYNAALALYNFRYTGGVETVSRDGCYLRFLGCYPCEL